MKTNIKFAALLFAFTGILFVSSCDADLDVEPLDKITELDFLNNPQNAVQLVNGVYNKNLSYDMYSFSWIGVTSITSDDADKGSSPGDTGADKHLLDELNFNSSSASFADVWRARYQAIGRANRAIFYLEQLSIDPALKSRLIGETEFLRAMWYFDLVRCFGGVPVVTGNISIDDNAQIDAVVYTRKSKAETYAQIEADLRDAMERLPSKTQYSASDLGRATKEAAQGLLAKSFLYQERWQESYDMANQLINSGLFSLLPEYANVWREVGENGPESIFEIQASITNGLVEYTNVQGPRGTPDLGWGFNTPSLRLTNAYEAGDKRKEATIMFIPSVLWDGFVAPATLSNPRYNYKAYHSSISESWDGNKSNTAKNLRILKYSDILLIAAEAGFHAGNSAQALEYINLIRVRADLAPATTVTLQSIWKERHFEMAMEHDRWFDLVRTGQAASAMAADGKSFAVGVNELFPIPQDQIIASGGLLIQNPGY